MTDVRSLLGSIDIYLLDQYLRGRIERHMTLLDAGCGDGRNLRFFLQQGLPVYAVDQNPQAIDSVRLLAASLAPQLPAENFRVEKIEAMSLEDAAADVVVCSAVLHFAADDDQFTRMVTGCWRVLRPGGVFFSRLASTIGMEKQVRSIRGRYCALPDGSERYLTDEAQLMQLTATLGGELLDPLKTTVVQDQRSMTTWVLRKRR